MVILCIVFPLEHDPTRPTAARPSPNAGISFFVNLPRKLKSIDFNGYHLHQCAWHLPRALDVASAIPHLENLLVLPNLQRFTVEHHPDLDSQTYDDYSECLELLRSCAEREITLSGCLESTIREAAEKRARSWVQFETKRRAKVIVSSGLRGFPTGLIFCKPHKRRHRPGH